MPPRQTPGAVLLAVCCLGVSVGVQVARDRMYPREPHERTVLYVGSGAAMRRIVLSFDALAADLYWIRAIQHYGGDRRNPGKQRKYELLYPLLDITTSLDPYFNIAYRFGAIFLAEAYPGGAGRPDLAIGLLRKGIAAQPARWQYYHDIGFVYYWHLRDMQSAAQWFRLAAAQPNAPEWLEPLAAAMLIEGGDRATARLMLQQILTSEEDWLRRMATRALLQMDALEVIDQLAPIAQKYPPPSGQPYSWQWLVRRGVLRRIPIDPTGVPFVIDPASGSISVSQHSELYPMPRASR